MKRPIIEYILIAIGLLTGLANLITSTLDIGGYFASILWTLLVLVPFCLPWQGSKYRHLFLISLIPPIYCSVNALPGLIKLQQGLYDGSKAYDGLPAPLLIGICNMHVIVIGTAILTVYAFSQTIKSRTIRLTQAPSASGSRG